MTLEPVPALEGSFGAAEESAAPPAAAPQGAPRLLHAESAAPPMPATLADTGLGEELVLELLLKTFYAHGELTGVRAAQEVALPFTVVDPLLEHLKREKEIEIKGTEGHGRPFFRYAVTGHGRERVREALERCQYVGPAPVPLATYAARVRRQTVRNARISWEELRHGFSHLVMSNRFLMTLGPAINSGRSLFLHGPAGNGKTLVAETIAGMLGGAIHVPHAVEVGGQIIKVYDPVYHAELQDEEEAGPGNGSAAPGLWRTPRESADPRWVRTRRPTVFTGGELTLEMLDLRYNPIAKFYEAPFQVKSNGGVFILDDFGRQLVKPVDLLNRWIVPLEKRIDYLTLHTGKKFPVPFDSLLIFATNLDPESLVDEAFLRRIRYKVKAEDPSREEYALIFRNYCDAKGVEYLPEAVNYIFRRYYGEMGLPPRCCHPRDLIDQLLDFAQFYGLPPLLSRSLIDRACQSYFVEGAGGSQAAEG